MSKIAIIVGTNTHWAPFYYRYEKILKDNNIDFDLIIWNRESKEEKTKAKKVYEFNLADMPNNNNPLKIFKFILFYVYTKKIIKIKKYEKLIFAGTYGCVAFFMSGYLIKEFSHKYWLDIRDYSYERFKIYREIENKLINNSFATALSSPSFTTFLQEYNYFYMHNIDENLLDNIDNYKYKKDRDGVIRISFIGNVRYINENICLLKRLGNDSRFCLQYFGKGSDKIRTYCYDNKINNVIFCGEFQPRDTIKFYETTDIINNVYGSDTIEKKLSLSNKLYYGLYLKLPILVSPNTYMEELISKHNIGYSFIDEDDFSNNLYNWYIKLSKSNQHFNSLLSKIKKEDDNSVNELIKFIINE